ncbi:MAG: hypothetical protein HY331_01285 [Chloroflexi bacterium]|nr:hypothetical protein [Chloroflexota bacterium]
MTRRTVLPDCCEDWILAYGRFYPAGEAFECLECSTEWRKEAPDRFVRVRDSQAFVRRVRVAEGAEFPYLAAADGHDPITERCCAQILLRHGPAMKVEAFACPICGTRWHRAIRRQSGVSVVCFSRPGLDEPLAIQRSGRRPFLVPLSTYSPPTE